MSDYVSITKSLWMEKVNKNVEKLRSLLQNYHPASREIRLPQYEIVEVDGDKIPIEKIMPITAPAAEAACQNIRREILADAKADPEHSDPLQRFNLAVAQQDIGTINLLLNEAWFGVPESTSCWGIEGFMEAVDLIEEPPEEEDSDVL